MCTQSQRLVKTGVRLVKHARYYHPMLAGSHLTRQRFGAMVGRIIALLVAEGETKAVCSKIKGKKPTNSFVIALRRQDSESNRHGGDGASSIFRVLDFGDGRAEFRSTRRVVQRPEFWRHR
jgi:hypothetical protein